MPNLPVNLPMGLLPMIVAASVGCVLLAIVLAWPWIADAVLQAEAEAEGDVNTNTSLAPVDAVEPLTELDMDDRQFIAWWTRCGC